MINKLIDDAEVKKILRLKGTAGGRIARFLMSTLQLDDINRLYNDVLDKRGLELIEKLLSADGLDIQVDINPEDLNNIPIKGPFIAVANHPYGAIDGILMMKIFGQKRKDFRLMANFILSRIKELDDFFIPVNPFENPKGRQSISGMKTAFAHVKDGAPLGIFPAGQVSSFFKRLNRISDIPWKRPVVKMIAKAQVPVVPVYFEGTNSTIFHFMGLFHPYLRTLRMPHELLNKRGRTIRVRIGKPVSTEEIGFFNSTEALGRYLMARVYSLQTFEQDTMSVKSCNERIIVPKVSTDVLEKEIGNIRVEDSLLSAGNFSLYCTTADSIPQIIKEIGRLREVSFRKIGEGTGNPCDIDPYDSYYKHMFIWDKENRKIVSALRFGEGEAIMSRFGKKGFYTNSLFRISKKMNPVLKQSMEIGRTFVTPEYQKSYAPLVLLWRGIARYLDANPCYRYLIGPVSISNCYPYLSKGLMLRYIQKYFSEEDFSKMVRPKNKFRIRLGNVDPSPLFDYAGDDVDKFDRMLSRAVYHTARMPGEVDNQQQSRHKNNEA